MTALLNFLCLPLDIYFSYPTFPHPQQFHCSLLHIRSGRGGLNVADASYYDSEAVNQGVATERMEFYSNVIRNVTALTSADGSNACLDVVLPNDVKIARMGTNETVAVRVETIDRNDLTPPQLDDCIWYLIYSLSLHPYVQVMEAEADVVVFPPPDGGDTSAFPAAVSSAFALVVGLAVSTFLSSLPF